METPEHVTKAIAAVGGEIRRASPFCEGSDCWIVEFETASPSAHKLEGATAVHRVATPEFGKIIFRAHFAGLTPNP